jgi:predicted MFS family arabinose efflux permease
LYTPFVYVTEKAKRELGIAPSRANLILSVLGACNTVSRVVTGLIADNPRVDCLLVHNIAAIVAGGLTCLVSVFNSYALLMLYGALFGIFIGGFDLFIISRGFRGHPFLISIRVLSMLEKFASCEIFFVDLA